MLHHGRGDGGDDGGSKRGQIGGDVQQCFHANGVWMVRGMGRGQGEVRRKDGARQPPDRGVEGVQDGEDVVRRRGRGEDGDGGGAASGGDGEGARMLDRDARRRDAGRGSGDAVVRGPGLLVRGKGGGPGRAPFIAYI